MTDNLSAEAQVERLKAHARDDRATAQIQRSHHSHDARASSTADAYDKRADDLEKAAATLERVERELFNDRLAWDIDREGRREAEAQVEALTERYERLLRNAADKVEALRKLLGEALDTRAPDYVTPTYPDWYDRALAALSVPAEERKAECCMAPECRVEGYCLYQQRSCAGAEESGRQPAEPVAWRCRHGSDGAWIPTVHRKTVEARQRYGGWEIEPLYAAPTPPESAVYPPDGLPPGDTPWKRFGDEKPAYDGWGERHLLTWNVRVASYDLACIDGQWAVGEAIDGHPDDLWRWLDENPERATPAEARSEQAGWQPFATAPRDGKPFLTFTPDDTFSAITGIEVMWFDSQLGLVYGPDCSEPVFKPTHWRPLPQPPGRADD